MGVIVNKDASAVTELTTAQFVEEVSGQRHAMAGAVIALSAAQAVALGQASMQISLQERVSPGQEPDAFAARAGETRLALPLLDSNLRIWPDELLLAEFEPLVDELEREIEALSPVERIRRRSE